MGHLQLANTWIILSKLFNTVYAQYGSVTGCAAGSVTGCAALHWYWLRSAAAAGSRSLSKWDAAKYLSQNGYGLQLIMLFF